MGPVCPAAARSAAEGGTPARLVSTPLVACSAAALYCRATWPPALVATCRERNIEIVNSNIENLSTKLSLNGYIRAIFHEEFLNKNGIFCVKTID